MRALPLALFLVLVGCAKPVPTAVAETKPAPPADPWVLACLDAAAEEPAWLSNGLMGLRLGRDGTGEGQPAFDLRAYEKTGEEKILTLPSPFATTVTLGGRRLSPVGASDYAQRLDMRTGELKTSWTQAEATVVVTAFVSPERRLASLQWQIVPQRDHPIEVASSLPGLNGQGPRGSATLGPGIQADIAFAAEGAVAGRWTLESAPKVYSGDAPEGEGLILYQTVSLDGPAPDEAAAAFHSLAEESERAWKRRWKTDIEIDGPVEDQQAVRSFLFYLRSAIHPKGTMAVSPFGLSRAQYNGHVFWDADLWVFPALALLDPDLARVIPDYRLRMHAAARENFSEWLAAERPTGTGKLGPIPANVRLMAGAKYPWESSITGRETVPGPSKFEDHITGTVAFALDQAASLGLADPEKVKQVGRDAAMFYMQRSEGPFDRREIKGTMSPDENHIGDNDLFTNLLAEWTDRRFWPELSRRIVYKRPKDAQGLLTYDNDRLRGYKQAAAVLAIYPLQDPEAESQAKTMMARFADKAIPNGPAMTDSVHATIWARLGEPAAAYDAWRKSWVDFTDNSLSLFAEKRRRSEGFFLTGAGGSLQTVLYGFLGFRLDSERETKAVWTTALPGDRWLSVRPNLPPTWKSVKLKNFAVLGRRYDLTVDSQTATVTPGE